MTCKAGTLLPERSSFTSPAKSLYRSCFLLFWLAGELL